jgi:hypothetical protein
MITNTNGKNPIQVFKMQIMFYDYDCSATQLYYDKTWT